MALNVAEADLSLDSKLLYFNRELSDLAFIERVLEESYNKKHPLLERLRFLSISATVLDQFYTVRVARMRRKIDKGITKASVDGLTPAMQYEKVNTYADHLLESQQHSWLQIQELLSEHHIALVNSSSLNDEELRFAEDYFHQQVMPALSPFMIDREHPFPYIPSGGLCVVAQGTNGKGKPTHILIPLPQSLQRFKLLPGKDTRIIPLESLVTLFIQSFFSDIDIVSCGTFQILRDNDLALAERFDDLRDMVETGVRQRERANVIRLKFDSQMPEEAGYFVLEALGVHHSDVIDTMREENLSVTTSEFVARDALIGLSDAMDLISSSLAPKFPHLTFPSYEAKLPQRVRRSEGDYFSMIRERDLMLHYPYDSFDVLVNFIRKAAIDPDVAAIKQTLYRTSEGSPIVTALITAAESGKSVIAVIELEARDNEKSNIQLAKRMEAAGVQIVYGIVDLKVHCKMTLVVRREEDATVLYTHFGTGNYHPENARLYTDLSYFTSNKKLCSDANKVFNYLTSGSFPTCELLSVAPGNIREDLIQLVDVEIENAKNGLPAHIWVKLNSFTDPQLINKFYEASCAGVTINMVVRRQCRLKPGVPGLSENISVKSIVGRYLEHSRIYCFANGHPLPGPKASVFISSADWMERNFDDRVEIMIPITDPVVHQQVLDDVMLKNIEDSDQSWLLTSTGEYERVDDTGFSVQNWLMENDSRSSQVL